MHNQLVVLGGNVTAYKQLKMPLKLAQLTFQQ